MNKYLQQAIKTAAALPYVKGQQRIVAIATDKRSNVLSVAFNSYTHTHPMQMHYARKVGLPEKVYVHAEVMAMIKARAQVHTLYVARVNRNGEPLLAAPCPICSLMLKENNIKNIIHT